MCTGGYILLIVGSPEDANNLEDRARLGALFQGILDSCARKLVEQLFQDGMLASAP